MTLRVAARLTDWRTFLWLLLPLVVAGCVSTPQVDWDARLGSYSRDMAIADYGPATRTFKLSDGSQMLEWLQAGGLDMPGSSRPVTRDSIYNDASAGSSAPRSLQLTFGPDGKLVDWNQSY
jgi:hypothetical protein